MNPNYEVLESVLDKSFAVNVALAMLNWDNSPLAPKRATELTAKAIGMLSMQSYYLTVNPEVEALLESLIEPEAFNTLLPHQQAIVKKMWKSAAELRNIPPQEMQEFSELCAIAGGIWEDAKANNDYASYKETLEKLISYQKRFANYAKKENQSTFDYILDNNEEGFTSEILDNYFDKLRKNIVPLMKKIKENGATIDDSFIKIPYSIEKQKEFNNLLAEHIGFDFERGIMAESEHPFTLSLHNKDVRFTNHYYENDLASAIFSTIHEVGHAIYEMNIDDLLTGTPAASPSMGAHESQSRLFENTLGRSKAFWIPLYDKLVSLFPQQLNGKTLDDFYKAINKSQASLIRIHADELSYSLHIMIRYEVEREIFSENVTMDDLPELWNRKYEEYLGIRPSSDAEGILQDSHWSFGGFGYFPSYAIGNAVAAQLMHPIEKQMDIDALLSEGNLQPILSFLREHIHKYGGSKNVNDFLLETTGEGFNPDYYIDYLTKKYSALYELD